RAVHGDRVHRDEPRRRCPLHRDQPEAQDVTAIAGTDAERMPAGEEIAPQERRALAKFLRNRTAVFGAALVAAFVLMAVLAPLIAPYDPTKTNFAALRKAPSALYWLGTDELGRDILSRVMHGGVASLYAGVVSVAIALAIGMPIGLVAGWFGGWIDAIIVRA